MIAYAIVGHFFYWVLTCFIDVLRLRIDYASYNLYFGIHVLYFGIHVVYNINILYTTSSINEVYYAKVLSLSHHAESHD